MRTFPDPLLAENPEELTEDQYALAREWIQRKYPARGDKNYIVVVSRFHPDDTKENLT